MEDMNPDDDNMNITWSGSSEGGFIDISSDVLTVPVDNYDWDPADTSLGNLKIDWANITMPGEKWVAVAVANDDELCMSNYQSKAHEDYAGLKAIWDEYVLMYKLVKGKEPGEEIL